MRAIRLFRPAFSSQKIRGITMREFIGEYGGDLDVFANAEVGARLANR